MTKPDSGKGRTYVVLDTFSFELQGCKMDIVVPLTLSVEYYYEEAIKATEDEPPCDEYIELLDVRALVPTYLSGDNGVSMGFDGRVNLVSMLTDKQEDDIITLIKQQ